MKTTTVIGRARRGKIARLPADLREQVNQRLHDGQPAAVILEWLNNLEAVKQVLGAKFGGVPVSEPNLSRWRTGGYREWCEQVSANQRFGNLLGRFPARQAQPEEVKVDGG